MTRKNHARQGFSLLELSIVLTIIAIVISGSLTIGAAKITQNEIAQTYDEMKAIKEALRVFAKANGRLPCPASMTMLPNDATTFYGKERETVANCTDTSAESGTYRLNANTGFARAGAVPVYSIGLGEEYLGDAWRGKYLYVVDQDLISSVGSAPSGTAGNLRVMNGDLTSANLTTAGAYALISFGITGYGAINTKSGVANSNACVSTTKDGENCNHTGTSPGNGTLVYGTYNNGTIGATTFFDDYIIWVETPALVN